MNGYRFPAGSETLRQDDPVPLGAEPWKELWPDAIWPGELPGSLPLSLYLGNDVRVARGTAGRLGASYIFPAIVNLQAASSLGSGIGVFAEVAWTPGSGLQVGEAKIKLQDILPWLPARALNLWFGAMAPQLITFADPGLDRAARHLFLWQRLRLSDWRITQPGGEVRVSASAFRLAGAQPTIELNGLAGGRLFYAMGLAQPGPSPAGAADRNTDIFLKLRYKFGGMALDGRPPGSGELRAWGGQLLDDGVSVEQFAHLGTSSLSTGTDRHRSFGAAIHAVRGRADVGAGYVWGHHSQPWDLPGVEARRSSLFARTEYLLFPWLTGSVKFDRSRIAAFGFESPVPAFERTLLMPGIVVLLRHNVRTIGEAELLLRDRPHGRTDAANATALWIRFDVMF